MPHEFEHQNVQCANYIGVLYVHLVASDMNYVLVIVNYVRRSPSCALAMKLESTKVNFSSLKNDYVNI